MLNDLVTFSSTDISIVSTEGNTIYGNYPGEAFVSVPSLDSKLDPIPITVSTDSVDIISLEAYVLTDVSFTPSEIEVDGMNFAEVVDLQVDLTQEFTMEGDVGSLYVYANLANGGRMDVSKLFLNIIPPANSFNVLDRASDDDVYKIEVSQEAVTRYGRFVLVEWRDVTNNVLAVGAPETNIVLDNATSVSVEARGCPDNTIARKTDGAIELFELPTSCEIAVSQQLVVSPLARVADGVQLVVLGGSVHDVGSLR